MIIRPAEIWLAKIPFTGGTGNKLRPILVLWLDGADAVAAAITTAAPRSQYDVPLVDWQVAGLRKPSTVRLARLDCLEQQIFLARLGSLSSLDASSIKQVWQSCVSPQF